MSDPLQKIKQKIQDELTALEHELNVDLPKEIAVARAHGDLSENAEYKFATAELIGEHCDDGGIAIVATHETLGLDATRFFLGAV